MQTSDTGCQMPDKLPAFNEKMFLNMVTAGFHVDFMRDEEQ